MIRSKECEDKKRMREALKVRRELAQKKEQELKEGKTNK